MPLTVMPPNAPWPANPDPNDQNGQTGSDSGKGDRSGPVIVPPSKD